jgi:Calcineurin-like phosphoesterase
MFREVLDRDVVLAELRKVREYVEEKPRSSGRRRGGVTEEDLSDDDRELLVMQLRLTESRERGSTSGQGRRRGRLSSLLDRRAFISRDPVISLLQSRLEECLLKHHPGFEDVEEVVARRGRGAAVDPVTPWEASAPSDRRESARRRYRRFEPCDPGWVASGIAWGLRAIRGKHRFVPDPAPTFELKRRARLFVFGDWATALPRAVRLAEEIKRRAKASVRDGIDTHVVHLGDTYYAGKDDEITRRLLDPWPADKGDAGKIRSWTLPGNHELYSGGKAYYEVALADRRFEAQRGSSMFHLANEHFQVLGLDTSWEDHDLKSPQTAWIERSFADADGRKTILLSHHQLFTAHGSVPPDMAEKLDDVLRSRPALAWFWGHEHRCILFKADPRIRYARCIGNSGVPELIDESEPSQGELVDYEFKEFVEYGDEKWLKYAFAVLDFDGASLHATYVDEDGKEFREETLAG